MGRVAGLTLGIMFASMLAWVAPAEAQCPCQFLERQQRTFKDYSLTCWGVVDSPFGRVEAGIDSVKVARNGSEDQWEYYLRDSGNLSCSIHHFRCRNGSCRESRKDSVSEDLNDSQFADCAAELETLSDAAPHEPLVLARGGGLGPIEIASDSCLAATTLNAAALADYELSWNFQPGDVVVEDFFPSSMLPAPLTNEYVLGAMSALIVPGWVLALRVGRRWSSLVARPTGRSRS